MDTSSNKISQYLRITHPLASDVDDEKDPFELLGIILAESLLLGEWSEPLINLEDEKLILLLIMIEDMMGSNANEQKKTNEIDLQLNLQSPISITPLIRERATLRRLKYTLAVEVERRAQLENIQKKFSSQLTKIPEA